MCLASTASRRLFHGLILELYIISQSGSSSKPAKWSARAQTRREIFTKIPSDYCRAHTVQYTNSGVVVLYCSIVLLDCISHEIVCYSPPLRDQQGNVPERRGEGRDERRGNHDGLVIGELIRGLRFVGWFVRAD